MPKLAPVPRTPDDSDELRPAVNSQVWFTIFSARTLLECFLELFKNGFDWNAEVINVVTDESRDKFRIIDNGQGMDARNRLAFVSVGMSTAGGDQSGTFGTGAKKIVFTFSSHVRVVTAPEDDPTNVYLFEFTPNELALAYSQRGAIKTRRLSKTPKNWPHEHPFGTDITFTLKDPDSRVLARGRALAQKLADRLDNVLVETGMVLVNSERLPPKKLTGRIFRLEMPAESNPRMGRIMLEFYRPAKKSSDEDLRMTGRSIGEVSFRDVFVKLLLSDEIRDLVPALFMESEVCGLVTAGFLNEYVTESRDRYNISIADDERVVELLRLLHRVEADVANHLGIKLRQLEGDDTQGKEEIVETIERLKRKWVPDSDPAGTYMPGEESGIGDGRSKRPKSPQQPPVLPRMLVEREEFALGEMIEVKLVVPNRTAEGFHFYTDQARAELLEESQGLIRLRANRIGRGLIQAVNPKTSESAKVEYEVVSARVLRLSATYLAVEVGSHTTVHALNVDKAKGALGWELTEGSGELTVRKKAEAATFKPDRPGRAQIVAYDSAETGVQLACEIRILPNREGAAPFRIRDQYFTLESDVPNTHAFQKLVTIINAGPGEVHRMVINPWAPGYQEAYKAGVLQEALLQSLSVEFAKMFCVNYGEASGSDIPSVIVQIQNEAALLFEEMLGS